MLRWLGEQQVPIVQYPVAAKSLAELISMVRGGAFETSRGREVLGVMVADRRSLPDAIAAMGIETVDDSALVELCRKLVAANPKIAAEVKRGQVQGPRRPDRPGEEGESQRQCKPRAGIVSPTHQLSRAFNRTIADIAKTLKTRRLRYASGDLAQL